MNVLIGMAAVVMSLVATAVPAWAQDGSAVLNRLEVQQLVAADTADAHAALAKHFIALADTYRRDATRYTTLANASVGNPNHPTGIGVTAGRMRNAEDAIANANTARAVAAYHLIRSIGGTSRRPAGGPAFDGGKGAPLPTRAALDELARMARTPSAHHELAEYFLILARTETTSADAYGRTARMARVSGGRNTETVVAHFARLASEARAAARRARLAAERHRQLAAIG